MAVSRSEMRDFTRLPSSSRRIPSRWRRPRALDKAAVRHRAEDAVRSTDATGLDRELLELDRIGMIGQHVEQLIMRSMTWIEVLPSALGADWSSWVARRFGKDRKLRRGRQGRSRMVLVRSDFA